jgi:DNA polymerase/3'-5' exonuclease PolX
MPPKVKKTSIVQKPSKFVDPAKIKRMRKETILENLGLIKDAKSKEPTDDPGKRRFKILAYQKAIHTIEAASNKLFTLAELLELKGIGKSMAEQLTQLFEDNSINIVQQYKQTDSFQTAEFFKELISIPGIGRVKANTLINDLGIRTLAELTKRQNDVLNKKQIIGLAYHEDLKIRIPRTEMDKHNALLKKVITKIDGSIKFELAGSYRREVKDSGDIDLLVTHSDPLIVKTLVEQISTALDAVGYIQAVLAKGEMKMMAICQHPDFKINRHIDIVPTSIDKYPFALMYFTGSKDFNVEMRNYALTMGYSLNQYCFTATQNIRGLNAIARTKFTTEEDIFNFLHLAYVAPKDRSSGAIEKSKKQYIKDQEIDLDEIEVD